MVERVAFRGKFIRLDDLYYHFESSYREKGFKFVDVLRWLNNIEGDPSEELRKKFIAELDMISPNLYITNYSEDEFIKTFSWPEIRKKIVDGIVDAKKFMFSSDYSYNETTFIRKYPLHPIHKQDILVELEFTVGNGDNKFGLKTAVYPGPHYFEEIKDKIDKIVHDFKQRRRSNAYISVLDLEHDSGERVCKALYEAKINTENVSEATTMLLSILDSTKKLF